MKNILLLNIILFFVLSMSAYSKSEEELIVINSEVDIFKLPVLTLNNVKYLAVEDIAKVLSSDAKYNPYFYEIYFDNNVLRFQANSYFVAFEKNGKVKTIQISQPTILFYEYLYIPTNQFFYLVEATALFKVIQTDTAVIIKKLMEPNNKLLQREKFKDYGELYEEEQSESLTDTFEDFSVFLNVYQQGFNYVEDDVQEKKKEIIQETITETYALERAIIYYSNIPESFEGTYLDEIQEHTDFSERSDTFDQSYYVEESRDNSFFQDRTVLFDAQLKEENKSLLDLLQYPKISNPNFIIYDYRNFSNDEIVKYLIQKPNPLRTKLIQIPRKYPPNVYLIPERIKNR